MALNLQGKLFQEDKGESNEFPRMLANNGADNGVDNGANNVAAVNNSADNALIVQNDLNVAAERILASLNSLADSDTGNPISIDGKIEILDLMKKRAQAQQQAQQQNTNGSLLAVIDSIKNRLETEFQEQYQRYYG